MSEVYQQALEIGKPGGQVEGPSCSGAGFRGKFGTCPAVRVAKARNGMRDLWATSR